MPSPINLIADREDYYHVRMAPDASYAFPNEEAAMRFAKAHKEIAAQQGVDREVQVWYPDGRAVPIIEEARCLNSTATESGSPGLPTSRYALSGSPH